MADLSNATLIYKQYIESNSVDSLDMTEDQRDSVLLKVQMAKLTNCHLDVSLNFLRNF